MPMLRNGDAFPKLDIPAVGGGTMSLPGDLAGDYGVALIYRGAWCPLCRVQLDEFATEKKALDKLGVRVVAFSVDDEATTAKLVSDHKLPFPFGHSADSDKVSALVGAFTNNSPKHLQPTAFILAPDGTVMTAVYSTSAVGRLAAADVVKFVGFMKSKGAATAQAAE